MSEPAAILIVPAEGDPHGLLREGPCGATAPVAGRRWWRERDANDELGPVQYGSWEAGQAYPGHHDARALVIAWNGEPVVEGIDRLCRAAALELPGDGIDIAELHWWLTDCESAGRLVLLDEDGHECEVPA